MDNVVPSLVSPQTFMEEVEKYESLCNKFNRDYKDKYKKFSSWTKIGETSAMTPQEAESKNKNIRTGFGRYLRRTNFVPSGSGRDAVPVPKEFANLKWLSVFIEHKKTTSNLKGDLTDSSGLMHSL